jgi:hypothetical protein
VFPLLDHGYVAQTFEEPAKLIAIQAFFASVRLPPGKARLRPQVARDQTC